MHVGDEGDLMLNWWKYIAMMEKSEILAKKISEGHITQFVTWGMDSLSRHVSSHGTILSAGVENIAAPSQLESIKRNFGLLYYNFQEKISFGHIYTCSIDPYTRVNYCIQLFTLFNVMPDVEAIICALKGLEFWVCKVRNKLIFHSEMNLRKLVCHNKPLPSQRTWTTLSSLHALHRCRGGGEASGRWRIHRCLAPPILMCSLLTEWAIWVWECQWLGPSILVPCPLGPEPARQPGSWQASALVSQAGACLDGSNIQQGQECAGVT